jgi:hypothetical protein
MPKRPGHAATPPPRRGQAVARSTRRGRGTPRTRHQQRLDVLLRDVPDLVAQRGERAADEQVPCARQQAASDSASFAPTVGPTGREGGAWAARIACRSGGRANVVRHIPRRVGRRTPRAMRCIVRHVSCGASFATCHVVHRTPRAAWFVACHASRLYAVGGRCGAARGYPRGGRSACRPVRSTCGSASASGRSAPAAEPAKASLPEKARVCVRRCAREWVCARAYV